MIEMRLFRQVIEYPSKREPSWASRVERWSQLDAAAFGLAETVSHFQKELQIPIVQPSFVILASPGSSNETDFQFVQSGALSPSKFVHTLPSVRSAPLLQVMNWQGPVLCLQNDPTTWLDGLSDAISLLSEKNEMIWILTVLPNALVGCGADVKSDSTHQVCLAELSSDTAKKKNLTLKTETFLIESEFKEENESSKQLMTDLDFWKWLRAKTPVRSFHSQSFRICRLTE